MSFKAKAVIHIHPSGEKFSFEIYRQDQVDKLIEILTILEQSAKEEQAAIKAKEEDTTQE